MAKRSYGSVRQLPSRRWQVRYVDPLTGKRLSAPQTFKSKGDARRWLAQVEAGNLHPKFVAAQRRGETLESYALRWVQHRNLRPRTEELYRSQLRLHIVPQLGAAKVHLVEPQHVREWHTNLMESGTIGSVTVAKVYRLLRSILNTAVEDRILASNPCLVRGGGVERITERRIPTLGEYQAVYDGLPAHLAAVAALAAFGGLRKGEALGQRRKDIDLIARTLRVEFALQEITGRGAVLVEPKTAKSQRTVELPDILVEILDLHLQTHVASSPESLLFTNSHGGPIRRSVWQPAWETARNRAGLNELRLHDLRHLAGTLSAQAGATLKETMKWLGHSTVAASLRYQHVADHRNAQMAQQMDQLIRDTQRDSS